VVTRRSAGFLQIPPGRETAFVVEGASSTGLLLALVVLLSFFGSFLVPIVVTSLALVNARLVSM
jgi:hypothetical protein